MNMKKIYQEKWQKIQKLVTYDVVGGAAVAGAELEAAAANE